MTKSKNTFYILVRISAEKNIFRYVTGFKNRLFVKWDKNEKAMKFGKYEAEEIIQGLGINGHLAYLVTTPDFMEDTMVNCDDELEVYMKQYKIVMISSDGNRTMATFDKLETAKNVFETVFKNSASETRSYSLIECFDNRETVLDSTKTKKE